MLGTLHAALEVRGIRLAPEEIQATVEGDNELVNGLPQLARVRVRYRLRVPRAQREAADKALARHQDRCPTAAWMKGRVEVSWEAAIEEKE
jgi:organic hydroperoxide reductase OsmC/OhrA